MSKKTIRIGSRESKLAVIQSEMVLNFIKENNPDWDVELLTMKTTGDKILDKRLDKIGGKGLFVKELDKALMDKRSELSVHSLKDLPMEIPEELPLVAFSKREDPRDALVLPEGADEINFDKPIGCSSLRRMIQLKSMYPSATFKTIRGNVQTRLNKVDSGEYSATILAAAGLKRLGLENRVSRYFEPDEMIPAAGQGILAVQGRADIDYSFLDEYADADATACAICERAFVRYLDGGCSSPIAAFAEVDGDTLQVRALYYDENTGEYITGKKSGYVSEAEAMGIELAKELKSTMEG